MNTKRTSVQGSVRVLTILPHVFYHYSAHVFSLVCPCVQFGLNYAEISRPLDKVAKTKCVSSCLWYGLFMLCGQPCMAGMELRGRMRAKFHIRQRMECSYPYLDLLKHWICFWCALSQEAREIKLRKQEADENGFKF